MVHVYVHVYQYHGNKLSWSAYFAALTVLCMAHVRTMVRTFVPFGTTMVLEYHTMVWYVRTYTYTLPWYVLEYTNLVAQAS
jgi:hypothetical protein